jgi:hypothetical protein
LRLCKLIHVKMSRIVRIVLGTMHASCELYLVYIGFSFL